MSREYEIFEIENKPGSSFIQSPQGTFFRDFDQSIASRDSLIAIDDGIPIDQIDISDLMGRLGKIVCSGTYSYRVKTVEGNTTRIALSKETKKESVSDLDLRFKKD